MKRWKVQLVEIVRRTRWVEVDAETDTDAEDRAWDQFRADTGDKLGAPYDWDDEEPYDWETDGIREIAGGGA